VHIKCEGVSYKNFAYLKKQKRNEAEKKSSGKQYLIRFESFYNKEQVGILDLNKAKSLPGFRNNCGWNRSKMTSKS